MSLNWDLKRWGALALVVCLLFTSGMYLSTMEREKESVSILARANNEGSGIFLRESVYLENPIRIDDKEGWDGLTFMTPGPSSIQHMILSDIVKEEFKMNFVQRGTPSSGNTVYWTQTAPGNMINYMSTEEGKEIDGGIAWEPHYAVAISDGSAVPCREVADTSDYWEGHPCCVVAANNTFLSNNENAVQRFLAGYVTSVEWINEVLAGDPDSEDYEKLLKMVIKIGTPNEPKMPESTAIDAIDNIQYAYEISDLAEQLADVVDTYKSLGIVNQQTLTEAGFNTSQEFTEHLIKGQHLENIFDESNIMKSPEALGYNGGSKTTIDVAYLAADIHQIGLHVGIEMGFFDDYGIHIRLNGPFGAGGDVMNALLSGHSDLGFVGSPPVVSSSANALRS